VNLKTSATFVLFVLLGFAVSAADAAFSGKVTQWMGHGRHDFDFNGKAAMKHAKQSKTCATTRIRRTEERILLSASGAHPACSEG